ncbi:MAG: metallophosphoesterase [Waddliaceae bacterium]
MQTNVNVWAIADLHLSFGIPNKEMDVFGENWVNWTEKIAANWRSSVHPDDLVLIAGDISWAMKPENALPDLKWIDQLPGTKLIIRGNHDYWWSSKRQVENVLPPSIRLIQNNAFHWKHFSIGGARLWDTPDYHFEGYIEVKGDRQERDLIEYEKDEGKMEKIFQRELNRLEMSLKLLDPAADCRIAMCHYPPLSADLSDSRASALLEKYHVNICVFGHLHNVKKEIAPLFGEKNGIAYFLTSCDYLNFKPLNLFS